MNRKDMPPVTVGAYRISVWRSPGMPFETLFARMSGDVVLFLEVQVDRITGADCHNSGDHALAGSPDKGGHQQDHGGNNRQKSH